MQPTSIDSFYAQIAADPALQQQLTGGATSRAEVIERAVAQAQRQGHTFSPEETAQWLAQRTAAAASSAPEELSDEQLEVVAGGKDRLNKVDFGPMRTRP